MKLKDLLAQKRIVESEVAERQEELQALGVLINRQRLREGLAPETLISNPPYISNNGNNGRQKRARGILKAAKCTLPIMVDSFTRTQFFNAVEMSNPDLEGKIRPDAMRGTLRVLIHDGAIEPTDDVSEVTGEALYRVRKS